MLIVMRFFVALMTTATAMRTTAAASPEATSSAGVPERFVIIARAVLRAVMSAPMPEVGRSAASRRSGRRR
jgi:hypothetical protein